MGRVVLLDQLSSSSSASESHLSVTTPSPSSSTSPPRILALPFISKFRSPPGRPVIRMDTWKVALVGDVGVGKTSMVEQFVNNVWVDSNCINYNGDVYDEARRQLVVDNQTCLVEVLQEDKTANGVLSHVILTILPNAYILIYSITSRTSYNHIPALHECILEQVPTFADENTGRKKPHPGVIMLAGNKCDRVLEREVSKEEGETLARQLSCAFYETSGKTAQNMDRMFTDIIRELRKRNSAAQRIPAAEESHPTDRRSRIGNINRGIRETTQKLKSIVK
ncbi:hypothetical protein D9613_008025 [Agrocybe pediades]|uniref:Uncharacterized protein n=1 Tax=Agrocybe pediades TaxID=84607 RepID=A0A8H4QNW1_9AGAR|nr:hypothetical protein D9613_008025 [Agrocybe pediades]